MKEVFDDRQRLAEELAEVKDVRKLAVRKRYKLPVLLKWRAEILELRGMGASYKDIAVWLRVKRGVTVSHTTVMRFIKREAEDGAEEGRKR